VLSPPLCVAAAMWVAMTLHCRCDWGGRAGGSENRPRAFGRSSVDGWGERMVVDLAIVRVATPERSIEFLSEALVRSARGQPASHEFNRSSLFKSLLHGCDALSLHGSALPCAVMLPTAR